MPDQSGGTDANTGRVGFFSDLYYDPHRGQWWGLSDRGPGGGTLHYATRVQRFKLRIDEETGAISGFKILKTVIFDDASGAPLDGSAPDPADNLANFFDPEGFVVVSDEYGPSLSRTPIRSWDRSSARSALRPAASSRPTDLRARPGRGAGNALLENFSLPIQYLRRADAPIYWAHSTPPLAAAGAGASSMTRHEAPPRPAQALLVAHDG